jgi:hypothetical protein
MTLITRRSFARQTALITALYACPLRVPGGSRGLFGADKQSGTSLDAPSLKGVWYRSMFGHSGWCASLEDWFDPKRLEDDYVPTGFGTVRQRRGQLSPTGRCTFSNQVLLETHRRFSAQSEGYPPN